MVGLLSESYPNLKLSVIKQIVWCVDQMIGKVRTFNVKTVIVMLIRSISVNPKDQRSLFLNQQIIEVLVKHKEGWLFQEDGS